MISFLELRNMLMEQHKWNRRVATLAARIYKGIDTFDGLAAMAEGDYGRPILSQQEYMEICRWR
jgi:hypothetical protein